MERFMYYGFDNRMEGLAQLAQRSDTCAIELTVDGLEVQEIELREFGLEEVPEEGGGNG